jgi:hypothetical protein
MLACCLLASKLLREDSFFAALAVMLASTDLLFEMTGTLIYLGLEQGVLPVPPQGQFGIYVIYVLWGIVSTLRALRLLVTWRAPGAKAAAVVLVAMVLLLVYMPRTEPWEAPAEEEEDNVPTLLQEETLARQDGLLQMAIDRLSPQRVGQPDLYFLGAAPYASQPTFVAELATVRKLLDESFDTAGRSLALMNHSATLAAVPIATASNLRTSLMELGELLNPEEDVLMLFVTTHGSPEHELAFDLPPLRLKQVNPTVLARMLADSGIKWKIIVLSACYSGGFIEALKDDNSLIITAADATHQSFGCEADSDFTWFSRAYFDQALREEARSGRFSFVGAFERAKQLVAEQEKASGNEASNPQMFLGTAMQGKLKALEARLSGLAGRAPAQLAWR